MVRSTAVTSPSHGRISSATENRLRAELRRFVLARPVLDYGAVEPGRRAIEAVHAAALEGTVPAAECGCASPDQWRSRTTSSRPSRKGAGVAAVGACAIGLLAVLAVRSPRAVAAILITLAAGLVACVLASPWQSSVRFNPISVAFAPLFIGIAIDFGIQFSVRYAAEHQAGKYCRRISAHGRRRRACLW
jgi:hypothetical protein